MVSELREKRESFSKCHPAQGLKPQMRDLTPVSRKPQKTTDRSRISASLRAG